MAPSFVRPFAPKASQHAISILGYIHFTSPIALLALFLVLFTAQSMATGTKAQNSTQQTDSRKVDVSFRQKSLFIWLSMGAISTFVGNFIVIILQVLLYQKDHWWCGKAVAVLYHQLKITDGHANIQNIDLPSGFNLRAHNPLNICATQQTVLGSLVNVGFSCYPGINASCCITGY